ncbi:uncharacterized protein I206_106262 [Kwoniella pini CBS 10737]|uniref:BRCT domain-containing protein n=1 Tax=Kwoniella pini CBS 10737 TaxID=1296096 RepID=A0A1B9I1L8_9TREE|nr:uncharacterized protein I206_05088 [Kwoniella pini CBS 10737]OCF49395.1 hypothetical protein I206_05088 [Kwoniella pini CBS 10737]
MTLQLNSLFDGLGFYFLGSGSDSITIKINEIILSNGGSIYNKPSHPNVNLILISSNQNFLPIKNFYMPLDPNSVWIDPNTIDERDEWTFELLIRYFEDTIRNGELCQGEKVVLDARWIEDCQKAEMLLGENFDWGGYRIRGSYDSWYEDYDTWNPFQQAPKSSTRSPIQWSAYPTHSSLDDITVVEIEPSPNQMLACQLDTSHTITQFHHPATINPSNEVRPPTQPPCHYISTNHAHRSSSMTENPREQLLSAQQSFRKDYMASSNPSSPSMDQRIALVPHYESVRTHHQPLTRDHPFKSVDHTAIHYHQDRYNRHLHQQPNPSDRDDAQINWNNRSPYIVPIPRKFPKDTPQLIQRHHHLNERSLIPASSTSSLLTSACLPIDRVLHNQHDLPYSHRELTAAASQMGANVRQYPIIPSQRPPGHHIPPSPISPMCLPQGRPQQKVTLTPSLVHSSRTNGLGAQRQPVSHSVQNNVRVTNELKTQNELKMQNELKTQNKLKTHSEAITLTQRTAWWNMNHSRTIPVTSPQAQMQKPNATAQAVESLGYHEKRAHALPQDQLASGKRPKTNLCSPTRPNLLSINHTISIGIQANGIFRNVLGHPLRIFIAANIHPSFKQKVINNGGEIAQRVNAKISVIFRGPSDINPLEPKSISENDAGWNLLQRGKYTVTLDWLKKCLIMGELIGTDDYLIKFVDPKKRSSQDPTTTFSNREKLADRPVVASETTKAFSTDPSAVAKAVSDGGAISSVGIAERTSISNTSSEKPASALQRLDATSPATTSHLTLFSDYSPPMNDVPLSGTMEESIGKTRTEAGAEGKQITLGIKNNCEDPGDHWERYYRSGISSLSDQNLTDQPNIKQGHSRNATHGEQSEIVQAKIKKIILKVPQPHPKAHIEEDNDDIVNKGTPTNSIIPVEKPSVIPIDSIIEGDITFQPD